MRSITATAFTSCNVTYARVPSADTAMYSGSISAAASCPGNSESPLARSESSEPFSEANEIVLVTVADAAPAPTSMILTEPEGLLVALAGSASLATRILVPAGVKVSWSGTAPTSSSCCNVAALSNNAT